MNPRTPLCFIRATFADTLLSVAVPPTPVSLPVLVTDLVNIAAIANGNAHGCALLLSGDVMCWGNNQYGQVGNGEISATFAAPVAIKDL